MNNLKKCYRHSSGDLQQLSKIAETLLPNVCSELCIPVWFGEQWEFVFCSEEENFMKKRQSSFLLFE